jgi:hypothetical protein
MGDSMMVVVTASPERESEVEGGPIIIVGTVTVVRSIAIGIRCIIGICISVAVGTAIVDPVTKAVAPAQATVAIGIVYVSWASVYTNANGG